MQQAIDIFLHLDRHLAEFVQVHGSWVYGLLFLIVFCETGLVVTPILPGDSLLFAVGALCGTGALSLPVSVAVLLAAAFLGDQSNYFIGRFTGPRVFKQAGVTALTAEDAASRRKTWKARLLNRKHLDRAHAFFERHGAKAVILGHFVPIVRTFVPFVAGAGRMPYHKFTIVNLIGVATWIGLGIGAGYAFGNIEIVKNNFSLVVLGVVAVSLIPAAVGIVKGSKEPATVG